MSYFDHPPMVAWMIGAGIHVFGDNELGVRALAQLQMLAASAVMFLVARHWYSRTISVAAALSLQYIPIYAVLGFLATMDSSLILFWLLAVLGFTIAVQRNKPAGWYLAGVATGAAMLSKYTAAFLPVGFILAALLHRPWRRQLLTIHPWIAVAFTTLIFSPVIEWNYLHDWASFRFQLNGRFDQGAAPHAGLHYFVGEQLLILTPVVLIGMIIVLARWFGRPWLLLSTRNAVAVAFSIPMLAYMVVTSIHNDVHVNWTAPLFLTLIPPLLHRFEAYRRIRFRRGCGFDWNHWALWTGRICATLMASIFLGLLTWHHWSGHAATVFGQWTQLAADVDRYENILEKDTNQEPLIAADGSFEFASEIAFYRRKTDSESSRLCTTSQWIVNGKDGLGFPYWMNRRDWVGRNCIYVAPAKYLKQTVSPRFDSVEIVDLPDVHLDHPYALAICRKMHPNNR